jgi:hypothetical protein
MTIVEDQRFEFGKNWSGFIQKHFSAERIEISKQHYPKIHEAPKSKRFSGARHRVR